MMPDVSHIGLFARYEDAQAVARFRADITGYRYRVYFDRANRWWNVRETTTKMMAELERLRKQRAAVLTLADDIQRLGLDRFRDGERLAALLRWTVGEKS